MNLARYEHTCSFNEDELNYLEKALELAVFVAKQPVDDDFSVYEEFPEGYWKPYGYHLEQLRFKVQRYNNEIKARAKHQAEIRKQHVQA